MTEPMTLDALITQLKKLRGEHTELGEARVLATGCNHDCWHSVEKVRPGLWNGEPMVELVTE